MLRWSQKELECMKILRERLSTELTDYPPYPELIGDRKFIRFLRGHDYNVDKITGLFRNHLNWRQENRVNEIRNQIIFEGCDHPKKFPKGEIILSFIKQIVITAEAFDRSHSPLCVEQYDFSPGEILKQVTIEDYILFMTYCLEYRSIILEQLSEEREREAIAATKDEEQKKRDKGVAPLITTNPYGVIVQMCVIRDLGIG